VIENHATQYYEVVQRPGLSLRQALNLASPIRGESGEIYYGRTHWNIDWRFRFSTQSDGMCVITSVDTTLSTTITLPKITGNEPSEFTEYLPWLIKHENRHKQIALDAAKEVDKSIAQMDPMLSCKDLRAEANHVGSAIVKRAKSAQREYDAYTNHGCIRGACLSH
jgi:predicted secreted Zn-dependent protease